MLNLLLRGAALLACTVGLVHGYTNISCYECNGCTSTPTNISTGNRLCFVRACHDSMESNFLTRSLSLSCSVSKCDALQHVSTWSISSAIDGMRTIHYPIVVKHSVIPRHARSPTTAAIRTLATSLTIVSLQLHRSPRHTAWMPSSSCYSVLFSSMFVSFDAKNVLQNSNRCVCSVSLDSV